MQDYCNICKKYVVPLHYGRYHMSNEEKLKEASKWLK